MTNLQEFLNQNIVEGITKKVPISDRLRDKDGNLFMAEIKAIDPKEIRVLRRKYTKYNKKGVPEVNNESLNEEIVIEYTIDPNFKDAESIKATGCLSPVQYMNKVLLSGEIESLNKAILEFSGYSTSLDELTGEVKKLIKNDPDTNYAYMAFIKMGMRPREFVEMDIYEKAVIIEFLNQYAKKVNKK